MSVVHPSPSRLEALRQRWVGEDARLRAIAGSMRNGRDWTIHLGGLPFVEEIPPRPGEVYGRDLRGADLRRFLRPELEVRAAEEYEAAIVAGIALEAERSSTPLEGISPFPAELDCAERTAIAMRRGERFFLGRLQDDAVGTIRIARRVEFRSLTGGQDYAEISNLAVLQQHRRAGIGAALMRVAENYAIAQGLDRVLLRTYEELGLVPWYESQGYEVKTVRQLINASGPACLEVICAQRLDPAAAGAEQADTVLRA